MIINASHGPLSSRFSERFALSSSRGDTATFIYKTPSEKEGRAPERSRRPAQFTPPPRMPAPRTALPQTWTDRSHRPVGVRAVMSKSPSVCRRPRPRHGLVPYVHTSVRLPSADGSFVLRGSLAYWVRWRLSTGRWKAGRAGG
ncbi:hypothetical protein NDU88_002936 [Pleurodeles waltl]|uniref:Uncharacterized protein n=1 Tax=Pleurodeles waltl TaxID=8319 RepID=A0AAV7UB21_PLEWA|nr:hypothetical protein NDU88_002936 [Pleurodeles waltl]